MRSSQNVAKSQTTSKLLWRFSYTFVIEFEGLLMLCGILLRVFSFKNKKVEAFLWKFLVFDPSSFMKSSLAFKISEKQVQVLINYQW